MPVLKILLIIVIGYLIGSISSAITMGKIYGIDIKKVGSGNAGATNVARSIGKWQGVVVFLFDFFKGAIAVLIASFILKDYAVLAGLFAIIGHNFPIYYGFKGGKGVSTTFGILLAIDFRIGIIIGAGVLVLLFTTKIMSLSNLICFAFLPLVTYFIDSGRGNINVYITMIFAVLIYFTHRENIKRLLNGTENKFGKKKQEENK
ncbi:MAG: glycerol-3-phosphate 1-O-acyltransferase PlsY [Clostridia bacterium]|nr:glycerol-3-phosphate 1-O-acyltransferase PlsY [Clostridia bacterium]